jgi:hypothetical protein
MEACRGEERDGVVGIFLRGRVVKVRRADLTHAYAVRGRSAGGRLVATTTLPRDILPPERRFLVVERMTATDHFERAAALWDLDEEAGDVFCKLLDRFLAGDDLLTIRLLPLGAVMYGKWAEDNGGAADRLPRVAYGLALALQELHARGLCARYLPPLAVWVVDGAPMLADFPGLVRRGVKMSVAGELPYAAPETLRIPHKAEERSDVWCVGALLLDALLVRDEAWRRSRADASAMRRFVLAACGRSPARLADVLYACMRTRARPLYSRPGPRAYLFGARAPHFERSRRRRFQDLVACMRTCG